MIRQDYELQAVFFDLDGTLVDSAPDLIVAMQRLRAELGETPSTCRRSARWCRRGPATLRRVFPTPTTRIELLLPRFLDLYAEAIATHTRLYAGGRRARGAGTQRYPLGRRYERSARALLAAIDLERRCAAMVSGDCPSLRKLIRSATARVLAGVDAGRSVTSAMTCATSKPVNAPA
jgi:phosphoglycolate phosphatase